MIKQIHVDDVAGKLKAGNTIYLLDVRQPWENEYCRIEDSVLVPLPELPERLGEIDVDRDAEIIVYCHHGVRSLSGAAILQGAGFTNVASMAGGIEAWSLRVDPKVPRY